ncbi:response regulator transcription factor [bacterium]|nr:response regulator transcription factor [bacterium]
MWKKNLEASSRILLVEDEESLAKGLEYNLTEEGYDVTWAADGKLALDKINNEKFDLIILDIMLPYINGFEVAQHVREKDPRIPILMLTARAQVEDRIHGLEAGADDYITKPFHLKELLLRVRGMLRRKSWYFTHTQNIGIVRFGKNQVDFSNLSCIAEDLSFTLTIQEATLLRYLIENKGRIVSRKEILENVWNMNPEIETRTIDNFVVRLRRYFEKDPHNPVFIISVRGAGYMFRDE